MKENIFRYHTGLTPFYRKKSGKARKNIMREVILDGAMKILSGGSNAGAADYLKPKNSKLHDFNVKWNPITPLVEAITGRSVETYGTTELSIKERVDALALFVVAGIGRKGGLKPLGLGSTGRTVAANLRQ